MKHAQHSSWFAENALFSLLTGEQLGDVVSVSHAQSLPRGATLFQRGDQVRGLYLLTHGQIKLGITSAHGVEKVFRIIGTGEVFCEDAICLDSPLPVYAQATTDTEVVFVPRGTVLAMMERNAAFSKKLLEGLSSRMHAMFHEIEAISLQNSTERLVRYLLQVNAEKPQTRQLTLPASKVTIASLLNLTPETFSRTMAKLQKAGAIEVTGRQIALDVGALQAMA